MKSKILALFLGFAVALSLVASAQRTGGFPSRPLFQSVTIGAGTRADTRQELRINATDQLGIRITGPRPVLKLNESTQAADNRLWYVEADGVNFRIRAVDDAEATATNPISIARSGATATDISLTGRTIHESGATGQIAQFNNTHTNGGYISFSRSGTPFGDMGNGPQIGGGASLDDFAIGTRGTGAFSVATGASITERFRIANTGDTAFNTEVTQQNGLNPARYWNDTDAAANNRLWSFQATGEQFLGRACTDAVSCNQFLTVDRTGSTVDTVNITATNVQANGAAIATQTSGTFTANFDTACTTTPTITYDYVQTGNVVTLYPVSQTGFLCTSDSTQFATSLADVPAAIRPNTAVAGPIGDAFTNNGANVWAEVNITSAGNIAFHLCDTFGTATCNVTGWTASGNKGAELFRPITYMLGNP